MMTWAKVRQVIEADMKTRDISRADLMRLSGIPKSTISTVFHPDTEGCGFDTVSAMLRSLGRSFAWLEKQCRPEAKAKAAAST